MVSNLIFEFVLGIAFNNRKLAKQSNMFVYSAFFYDFMTGNFLYRFTSSGSLPILSTFSRALFHNSYGRPHITVPPDIWYFNKLNGMFFDNFFILLIPWTWWRMLYVQPGRIFFCFTCFYFVRCWYWTSLLCILVHYNNHCPTVLRIRCRFKFYTYTNSTMSSILYSDTHTLCRSKLFRFVFF